MELIRNLRSECVLVFLPYAGQFGRAKIILFLTNKRVQFFAGYSASSADSTMVLPTPGGLAGAYGYWLQPASDGHI
jgi:hypothetical protein